MNPSAAGRPMKRSVFPQLAPIALLAACFGIGGGGGGGGAGPATPAPPRIMPPPVPLFTDNRGGIRDSTRAVIRDAGRLATIWEQATAPQATPPSVPGIDFDREMVILVAYGRATPEEEIHVDSLLVRREMDARGDEREVLHIVVRSVKGCGRFRTEAFPLEIVSVRRFDGPVSWDERTQQLACGPDAPETNTAAVSPAIRSASPGSAPGGMR